MLVASEKPTGTSYTAPAAIVGGVICIGLARNNWMKSSQLSISSIAHSGTRTK